MRALCHDLIQPLTAIRLLADGHLCTGEERMAAIRHEVSWLTELVGSVLGDGHADEQEQLELTEVTQYALSCCGPFLTSNVTLDTCGPVPVQASRVALVRALMCLLDNAARAAGPRGKVAVTIRKRGSSAVLAIADDGPGLGRIAPQHSIGLVTVGGVLQQCGGRLRLENGPRGGAVATVELPLVEQVERP